MGLIVLSMHTLPLTIEEVARAGAHAFVAKDDPGDYLLETIWRVASGQRGLFPAVVRPVGFELSEREKEVIEGVVQGLSTKEISERLCLSPKTVELYRTRLLRKFGLAKSTELVRVVLESGVFPAESATEPPARPPAAN